MIQSMKYYAAKCFIFLHDMGKWSQHNVKVHKVGYKNKHSACT